MVKILVVDDSEALRVQLTKDIQAASFEVISAGDGLEGIEKLKAQNDIKLILADVNMPNMDGLTMVENLRQLSDYKSVPVIMLTTETSEEMKKRAKASDVRAWIRKPYAADKLIAAIKLLTSK